MDIPRGDWPALFKLLDEALELPDEVAREQWLRSLHPRHQRLKGALRLLLARHDRAEVHELRQAQRRGPRLARQLAGDLDTITLLSTRETGYAHSAAAARLARDIERCLRDEPPVQRDDGTSRHWGLSPRHRIVLALLILFVLAWAWMTPAAAYPKDAHCTDEDASLYSAPHSGSTTMNQARGVAAPVPCSRRCARGG